MTKHITLKTGGDPRTLPDYAALRDELSKLTHPARPDVNWQYVQRLCLSMFEQNGVELQTAAWYTLARTHLSGLQGVVSRYCCCLRCRNRTRPSGINSVP